MSQPELIEQKGSTVRRVLWGGFCALAGLGASYGGWRWMYSSPPPIHVAFWAVVAVLTAITLLISIERRFED